MYYGLDCNGKKVFIDDSSKEESYRCTCCGGMLRRKASGEIRAHHFAHIKNECDKWYHENKGEWHRSMQAQFDPKNCEVRIENEKGEFHIADVFIEGEERNTVIEFQHSPISTQEFNERNIFYSWAGCKKDSRGLSRSNKVVWVFDLKSKRLFIDLREEKDKPPTYSSINSLILSNEMCREWYLLEEYKREEERERRRNDIIKNKDDYSVTDYCFITPSDAKTQFYREPRTSMYVDIIWMNSKKIFDRIRPNIKVFFDVSQRRYVMWDDDNGFGVKTCRKLFSEYSEGTKGCEETLAEFLVLVSAQELEPSEQQWWSQSYSLRRNPKYLRGVCFNYNDFFDMFRL
jgi:hypothetical protein